MAFKLFKTDDGRTAPLEYQPTSAITPKLGLTLTVVSGKLAIAAGTTKPVYICMAEKDTACTAGDIIPVIRIDDDMIFETTNSAAFTSIALGNKVTIATGGLQVTATTANGVAEVVGIDGTEIGSTIYVRFS